MSYRSTFLVILYLLSVTSSAAAIQWKHKALPHFNIYYVLQDEHYAETLKRSLEQIRERIISDIGKVDDSVIDVYIAPSHSQFTALKPTSGPLPPWAAAVAFSGRNLILIRSPRLLTNPNKKITETALHEVAHILLGRAVGQKFLIPRWLNEGFAMYEAGEWNLWNASSMVWASVSSSFLPFDQLTTGFPQDEREAKIAYLQSISMIAYLLDEYGRDKFISFIRLLRKEGNLNYSLKGTYGITMKGLEARWLKKMRLRYSWIPIGTGASTIWSVLVILMLAGYLRKRSQSRKILREWELEEEGEERWYDFK